MTFLVFGDVWAEEACEILGVPTTANDGAVKKSGEAQRQAWHPDHALNEADRQAREDRMRQVNNAIDILTGKRAA